jgi:sugar lactone lactonase YvrE
LGSRGQGYRDRQGSQAHESKNAERTSDHVYDADGGPQGRIEVPENPANVCFGGDDGQTLFITARTSLYGVRLTVAGAQPVGAKW